MPLLCGGHCGGCPLHASFPGFPALIRGRNESEGEKESRVEQRGGEG